MRKVRRRAQRSEEGSVLVEAAVVVPLLLLLLFGILDFGTIYSNQISLRQGVREAARQGAVANFGPAPSAGCLNGTVTASSDMQALMCLTKSRVGLGDSNVYVNIAFDGSYAVNSGLIVCAMTPAKSITGITSQIIGGRYQKTMVEMTVEQVSGQTETAGGEAPPTGQDWSSWCKVGGGTP